MRTILLFIGILVIPFIGVSQNTDEQILKIRAEFQRINSNHQLEKMDLYNEEFMEYTTDGGGQLTGYFENGQLVKYIEWIGVSHGSIVIAYYLKEGKLFFAYEQENKFKSVYDASGEWMSFDTSLQPETIFEGRYYFNNSRLIKELKKGERMFNRVFEQSKFLEHAHVMSNTLRKKR
ncbi:hypothetical protein ATE84_0905 [Aquimarina sp. MAR_2010_214]|uniref:hypothetical protein n=1 Tax=Aquimarina sp. MAR_2010_214 TaxID=1250026 RepID=UPI000C7075F5|nr:hypothetical protein [Aquimarina sp. MAR_2010_214]PKV48889.1 hypothetical protein ATE84_0905 [Aquimarina sp. MAR_2010_214]